MTKLRKCPRCELNYILDDGPVCSVCYEDLHGHKKKEAQDYLCSACGEHAPVRGQDLCAACLAELRNVEMTATGADEDDAGVQAPDFDADDLSELEEIDALEDLDGEDGEEIDDDYAPEALPKAQ